MKLKYRKPKVIIYQPFIRKRGFLITAGHGMLKRLRIKTCNEDLRNRKRKRRKLLTAAFQSDRKTASESVSTPIDNNNCQYLLGIT